MTLATDTLLDANELSIAFGGRQILDAVSLSVRDGQIVTLIGPNGAGKTTLIKLLLGIVRPDAGAVTRRPGLRIGYMPQRVAIDSLLPMSVYRFMQLGGRQLHGNRRTKAIEQRLDELAIAYLRDAPLVGISGGELQRVLLARALLGDPGLLVLDEPAQGVDLSGQTELYRLIKDIRDRSGCGILMISHDLHLVMSATDEVVCLNHHVCCEGQPDQVSNDPAFLELFGADQAAQLAVYTHHHNHEHDVAGEIKHDGHGHDHHD